MQPLSQCPKATLAAIETVFTDIDDTLTADGRLPAIAYQALENLSKAGIAVVPVTGRPAGWCDLIARLWPVDGVIGENGAFYFRYDRQLKIMNRVYHQSPQERATNQAKLEKLKQTIIAAVPGADISADQAYREIDLAIDFCEDVEPLGKEAIHKIVRLFEEAGATAKISSIHVNGWFGTFDKLTMTTRFANDLGLGDITKNSDRFLFVGDSPNDAPMFHAFRTSIGVANVQNFANEMSHLPSWITDNPGGQGFAELANQLLDARPA